MSRVSGRNLSDLLRVNTEGTAFGYCWGGPSGAALVRDLEKEAIPDVKLSRTDMVAFYVGAAGDWR